MITSEELKTKARTLGADLVGVAPASRFKNAPQGFKPRDIYPDCKSVLVFAKRTPKTTLYAFNPAAYTWVQDTISWLIDQLTMQLTYWLEDKGVGVVPVPANDPYEHWDAEQQYGRATLSMRHAGHLAGLGVLGKNTLLMNEQFGNMIEIGAILLDVDLRQDPIVTQEACPADCRLCLDSCPVGALDGVTVNQKLCRPLSNCVNEKGYTIKRCNTCRQMCPLALGIK